MTTHFRDRHEAGRLLAEELSGYANRTNILVLGLPRGGVPVAAEVARSLRAALELFVVRKLGLPSRRELAMGAIATGGVRVLNSELVEAFQIPGDVIDAVAADEQCELQRRERAYRDDLPAPHVEGKTVIVVDDGIATGSTMLAAVAALRQLKAGRQTTDDNRGPNAHAERPTQRLHHQDFGLAVDPVEEKRASQTENRQTG